MRIVGQSINMRYIGNIRKDLMGFADRPVELPDEVKHRIRIVEFGIKHGYKVATEAFNISKSTYYNYLKLYRYASDALGIKSKSKKPKKIRKANWDNTIVRFIKLFREKHANIGKEKIKYYLDKFCTKHKIKSISTGTIQNIINSFPNKLKTKKSILVRTRRSNVIRKPAKYKPKQSGECIALDSMEFRQNGKKLYVVVAIDEATNLLYAEGRTSHTSRHAKDVLDKAHNYLPWDNFNIILTDNGSEFQKDFAKYLKLNNITHYHTYPKTPKQNARCERVNRIIQDEFMIKYGNLLFEDINKFNNKFKQYLHWYNFKRVHHRFKNKMTPFEKHLELTKHDTIITYST